VFRSHDLVGHVTLDSPELGGSELLSFRPFLNQ
jgi:hypothetical protein